MVYKKILLEGDALTFGELMFKNPVRCATTANIALTANQTIDGVATATGDRVLVKNQTTGSENGIYTAGAGAWTRATDLDASAEVKGGLVVPVSEGTVNGNTEWMLTTDDPITLGTTALTFAVTSGTRGTPSNIGAANSAGVSNQLPNLDHVHAHPDLGDLHSGYILASGTRAFTGNQSFGLFQLLSAVAEQVGALPGVVTNGRVVYLTTDNHLYLGAP